MRILSNTFTLPVTALGLALLTAGCDRLRSATTVTHREETRTTLVKDTSGKTVRLDPATGEVTPVDKPKGPAPAPQARRRKPAGARPAAVHTRVEPSIARALAVPVRSIGPQAPITAALPEPAPVAFDEVCAAPWDAVAVTLVDTGVYAKPSVGWLVNRVVSGTLVTLNGPSGDWVRVNVERPRGPLSGFIHCSALRPLTTARTAADEPDTTQEF